MVLIAFLLIAASLSSAQPRAQRVPSLVPEAGRIVPISRGATVRAYQIASSILKETRRVYIVLPESFSHSAPNRRYPVTVVLDGEDNVPPVAAVTAELSRNGQIPESVIVAIPNVAGATYDESARNRVRDLTPPGLSVSGSSTHERGDLFLDFIERELLPAVDRQFRGGAPRTFIGHSSGGILATYVAATRPAFRAVIAIDTPMEFGDNWLSKKLMARAAGEPTPLRYVSYEVRFGWREDIWQALVAKAPSSWKLHREHLAGESHESMGMLGMYLGLREVFSDYSMLSAPAVPATSVLPYYAKLASSFGAAMIPPRKLLRNVVQDLLAEGRGAAAREAYNTLVSGYGAPEDAAAIRAEIIAAERRPSTTETVEELTSTPFPTPSEARAYIGEWIGDVWMNSEEVRTGKITLRIRVVDGRVMGETIHHDPAGDWVQQWKYLRITPAGMTWGLMNGMRPYGLVLFEGLLAGDTLAGSTRFGGLTFGASGGSPPALHFSFKRQTKKPA